MCWKVCKCIAYILRFEGYRLDLKTFQLKIHQIFTMHYSILILYLHIHYMNGILIRFYWFAHSWDAANSSWTSQAWTSGKTNDNTATASLYVLNASFHNDKMTLGSLLKLSNIRKNITIVLTLMMFTQWLHFQKRKIRLKSALSCQISNVRIMLYYQLTFNINFAFNQLQNKFPQNCD